MKQFVNDQSSKGVSSRHSAEQGGCRVERSFNNRASWIQEYLSVFCVGANTWRAAHLSRGAKGFRYPSVANLDFAFSCKLIQLFQTIPF